MAMGQAAAAVATLATQTRVEAESVPMADVRALLEAHDAIVP